MIHTLFPALAPILFVPEGRFIPGPGDDEQIVKDGLFRFLPFSRAINIGLGLVGTQCAYLTGLLQAIGG